MLCKEDHVFDSRTYWIATRSPMDLDGETGTLRFRKTVPAAKKIRKAVIRASALGCYDLYLNGLRVDERYFAPGYTQYTRRVQYQEWDVTDRIGDGESGESWEQLTAATAADWERDTGGALPADGTAPEVRAKGAVLMDLAGGRILYELNADARLPIASVTKVMTMLLVFEAMDAGVFTPETVLACSPEAASYGGSQIWLEPGEQMSVDDLLKAVAVVSANDACAVLAEGIDGSVEGFVARMNRRAAELGMVNTLFLDCCGLDDGAYSSARDVAIMSRELLKHEAIRRYTAIWTDTVRDGAFGLSNTNKLVRFYEGTTGLKTGYTSRAGHCLSASAKRNGIELIAVVLGDDSSSHRFEDAKALLNWGFANYALADPGEDFDPAPIPVRLGTSAFVLPVLGDGGPVLTERAKAASLTREIELPESLEAPVEAGQVLGTLRLKAGDEVLAELPLTAPEAVPRLTFWDLWLRVLAGILQ